VPTADIIVTDSTHAPWRVARWDTEKIGEYALPGDDRVWLLERVNKQPRPIPVIAVSGYSQREEPRLATAPFAGKLLKPLDFDRLCAEIAAALDNRT
jgi:DNA-binding NarL/FixJ family response regulator